MLEKEELVRRQPFLPYALILSKHDINTLAAHDREVCTSFPVPIILREHLEECMVSQDSGLLELQGVHFFMWFNEKLLDENALRLLAAEKEQQIQDKKMQKRGKAFALFCREYQSYIECMEQMNCSQKEQERHEQNRRLVRDAIEAGKERMAEVLEISLPASIQVQEARFEAITSKMSMQVQDLEKQLQKTAVNLNKQQKELERLSKKYHLTKRDWAVISYDEKEEIHQEMLLEDRRGKWKLKDRRRI